MAERAAICDVCGREFPRVAAGVGHLDKRAPGPRGYEFCRGTVRARSSQGEDHEKGRVREALELVADAAELPSDRPEK